jgi:hypothetical protein
MGNGVVNIKLWIFGVSAVLLPQAVSFSHLMPVCGAELECLPWYRFYFLAFLFQQWEESTDS